MAGKFEVFKDKADKFHFHLKAGNGEIVLESQGYESKEGAKKGIASIQTNAPGAEVIDLTV
ncbi:YegP family protein [Nocardia sp. NPDC058705]|uniref:YegP family protein n=1 Tax=Nocardia sp. NPDC058705 TaxID=3346609 RepID=UPI0036CC435C